MPEKTDGIVYDSPAFIHPTAQLYGKITMAEGSSIWPYAVVRAEAHEVQIGKYSNIQDFVMIHIGWQTPTIIGEYCSITHHCTLHGCTIGNNVLVGINSTIMDGCVIGDNCIIAGHTFLKEGTVIPDNSIVMGSPGEAKKSRNNFVANRMNALYYHRNALAYQKGDHRAWNMDDDMAAFTKKNLAEVEAEYVRLYGG